MPNKEVRHTLVQKTDTGADTHFIQTSSDIVTRPGSTVTVETSLNSLEDSIFNIKKDKSSWDELQRCLFGDYLDNNIFTSSSGYVGPINSSGVTMYTTPGYFIDRWTFSKNGTGTASISVVNNGLMISSTDNTTVTLIQVIPIWIYGRSVSFSTIINGTLYTATIKLSAMSVSTTLQNGTVVTIDSNDMARTAKLSVTIPYSTTNIVRGFSLVEGSVPYYDDLIEFTPKRNIIEELNCKRYQVTLTQGTMCTGIVTANNRITIMVPTPVRMAAVPQIIAKGSPKVSALNAGVFTNYAIESIVDKTIGDCVVTFTAQVSVNTLTIGSLAYLKIETRDDYVILNANMPV